MKQSFYALTSLRRFQKMSLQIVADSAIIALAFVSAMALRLENLQTLTSLETWLPIAVMWPLTIAGFWASGLYQTVIRYMSPDGLWGIGVVSLLSALGLAITNAGAGSPLPRSIPMIYAILLFTMVSGLRFFAKGVFRQTNKLIKRPVLIYGAGEAGRQLLIALTQGREYAPVGLVDDDRNLQGMLVGGLRVQKPTDLPGLVEKTSAAEMLLAMPSISRKRRQEIIQSVEYLQLEIKTIPSVADIISGREVISDLRPVSPADLLGRDPVTPVHELMSENITGKAVMVTGAGGSIGSELCRQILSQNPQCLILFELSEFALYAIEADLTDIIRRNGSRTRIIPILGSVQNRARLESVIQTYRVQTIYHAAAYKHVPLVEENVIEGIQNNVFGTLTTAQAARKCGVERFILVSTDKAVRPKNVMGASKRLAELACQALAKETNNTVFSMVRFGNVLGSSGSVIPLFQTQISRGGPVTVTHRDINRYFMTIPEAAQLVIQAGAMGKGGDVFVLDMGEPVKILDLAMTMIRLQGQIPYVTDATDPEEPQPGHMPIHITGLRKGEKLYEELLIGENPSGTQHPRIMTASEISLSPDAMRSILDQLHAACVSLDMAALRRLLIETPLGYDPTDAELADLIWVEGKRSVVPGLRVIDGSRA